jgi:hypothetical protein
LNHPLERQLQFCERRSKRRAPWIEHDVPLRTEFGTVFAERFAQPALDSVARDRFPDRPRNRKPEADTFSGRSSRQTERREQGAGEAKAIVIDLSEIGRAQDPGRSRKKKRSARAGFTWP